eukprot:TRINITY_DN38000_c0_g1_i1.p1 TRINITY_DN38000_c0_g1~~TRINITY_DN38000_c0_g1_i1.p1  ORF type:complete len:329 (+),score=47.90 TRINITY_DN38000_c0_g1_i1:150-1136(+)
MGFGGKGGYNSRRGPAIDSNTPSGDGLWGRGESNNEYKSKDSNKQSGSSGPPASAWNKSWNNAPAQPPVNPPLPAQTLAEHRAEKENKAKLASEQQPQPLTDSASHILQNHPDSIEWAEDDGEMDFTQQLPSTSYSYDAKVKMSREDNNNKNAWNATGGRDGTTSMAKAMEKRAHGEAEIQRERDQRLKEKLNSLSSSVDKRTESLNEIEKDAEAVRRKKQLLVYLEEWNNLQVLQRKEAISEIQKQQERLKADDSLPKRTVQRVTAKVTPSQPQEDEDRHGKGRRHENGHRDSGKGSKGNGKGNGMINNRGSAARPSTRDRKPRGTY